MGLATFENFMEMGPCFENSEICFFRALCDFDMHSGLPVQISSLARIGAGAARAKSGLDSGQPGGFLRPCRPLPPPVEGHPASSGCQYVTCLESMTTDRDLRQAFLADCRRPDKTFWHAALTQQLK